MSTMKVFSNEYSVVYVDIDIDISTPGYVGDGSSPSQALEELPLPSSMVDETIYLCRRTSSYQTISTNDERTTSSNGILVIGMPISGDPLYVETPSEAISAWGSDSDEYFRLYLNDNSRYWRITSCDKIGFHRICFEVNNTKIIDVWNLQFSPNNVLSGIMFETNCRFKTFALDYTDELETTNHLYNGIRIYHSGFENLNISNCEFQINGSSNSNAFYNMLHASNISYLDISDNEFYFTSSANGSSNYVVKFIQTIYDITFTRNKCYLIGQSVSNCDYRNLFQMVSMHHTIEDISFIGLRHFEDISTFDTGELGTLLYAKTGNGANASVDQGGIMTVRNITVEPNFIFKKNNHSIYLNNRDYDTANGIQYEASFVETVFENISFSLPISGTYATYTARDYWPLWMTTRRGRINNINIVNPGSINNTDTYGIYAEYCRLMTNITCRGEMFLRNVGFCEVNSYIYDGNRESVINNENSTIYIKDAQFTQADQWGGYSWLKMQRDSSIFADNYISARTLINKTNLPKLINWSNTSLASNAGVWINNIAGTTGFWGADNYHYQGDTWNTQRIGGSSASIKLSKGDSVSTESNIPLWIAPKEFKGLQWTPTSIGTHTLKVYVALKLLSDAKLAEKMQVLLYVPKGISEKTYISYKDGVWKDDLVSVWIGDTGLNAKVLEIPFEVTTLDPVTVRMRFSYYDAGGYLYLDPQVVFE